jgi:hypothetical protein
LALLARHGPIVVNVCHRIVHDGHAAEDLFQATFLVLADRGQLQQGAVFTAAGEGRTNTADGILCPCGGQTPADTPDSYTPATRDSRWTGCNMYAKGGLSWWNHLTLREDCHGI